MKKKILIFLLMFMLVLTMNFQVYAIENTKEYVTDDGRKIDPDKPMIALTFDDGPSRLYTSIILEVLKRNDAVATFFVVGTQAEKNKDILERIISYGNEIGNHSYSHKDLTDLSDEALSKELDSTDKIVNEATGYTPTLLRPPHGFQNEELNKKIYKPIILWSLDTRDWESRDHDMVSENILTNVKDGDIVLMHDIYESTSDAVQIVVPELKERGYQFVTVSELFRYRNNELNEGNVYSKSYK